MTDPPALPDAARQRVLGYASDALGALDPADVPAALRPFASFTPARRARLAGAALAATLEALPAFRHAAATVARLQSPDLAAAVESGAVPAAADPAEAAALAYLLRPEGWESLVSSASSSLRAAVAGESAAEVARLREEVDAVRRSARAEQDRLRDEVTRLRGEVEAAKKAVRTAADAVRRAEQARDAAVASAAAASDGAVAEVAAAVAAAETAARRQRARIAELESAVEVAKRAGREGRSGDVVRLRLLLDAVVEGASGLRRELGLPPTDERPGDAVAARLGAPDSPAAVAGGRGLAAEDPAYLEALLSVPSVHLVVDGYNVTKTGYPALSLEQQRGRLVTALRGLAARTRAEVTCVFDGASLMPGAAVSNRAVRVHFSAEGRTADEDIAAFVAAEPPGRPVVVVSSDREVADRAVAAGATAVPSTALVALLAR